MRKKTEILTKITEDDGYTISTDFNVHEIAREVGTTPLYVRQVACLAKKDGDIAPPKEPYDPGIELLRIFLDLKGFFEEKIDDYNGDEDLAAISYREYATLIKKYNIGRILKKLPKARVRRLIMGEE